MSLDYDSDQELGDDLELFDQEQMSDCGLTDFKETLVSWREFITWVIFNVVHFKSLGEGLSRAFSNLDSSLQVVHLLLE